MDAAGAGGPNPYRVIEVEGSEILCGCGFVDRTVRAAGRAKVMAAAAAVGAWLLMMPSRSAWQPAGSGFAVGAAAIVGSALLGISKLWLRSTLFEARRNGFCLACTVAVTTPMGESSWTVTELRDRGPRQGSGRPLPGDEVGG